MTRTSRRREHLAWAHGLTVGAAITAVVAVLGIDYLARECSHLATGAFAFARAILVTLVRP